jgi:hypothetical protein
MPRRFLFLLVALLALSTTACQVTISAGIDVGRDGSGRVTAAIGLDNDAVEQVGDLATALRVDDLRRAGWQVESPRRESDGLTWVRASKPFAEPEQAAAIVAELNGPEGPFRDFRVVRTKSVTRSKTTFTGTLDLSRGLAGLADPELVTALGDVDLGLDVEGLRRRFGADLAQSVKVEATAGLPGKITTNAPARDGGRALWAPELGQTVQLRASSEALRVDPIVPIAAGAALVVLVGAVVIVVRRRRRRRRSG